MTRITSKYPTIESIEIHDIEQAMRRAHRLRSKAFTSFLSGIFPSRSRTASDETAAEPNVHSTCASTV